MAEAFAPTADFSVASEQPVAGVENRAAEVAIRGVSGPFESLARTKSAGASQSLDPLRQQFLEQLNVIEAQRSQGHGTKADLNMRRLMQNYTMAGGDFEQGFDTDIESTTGRSFEFTTISEDQRQFEAVVETEEYRMAYMAEGYSNPNATEQERTTAALTAVGELNHAAQVVSRAQAGEQVNWETQLSGSYQSIVNSFKGGTLASLMQITEAGGTLGPTEVATAKLQWDQLKVAALKRPDYVSDAQWQSMESQFNAMDDMFESMTKIASSELAIENLKSVLNNSLIQGDGSDLTVEETLGIIAFDRDPNAYLEGSGINQADLLVNLKGRSEAGMANEAEVRLSDTLTQATDPTLAGVVDNQIIQEVPEEFSGYADMSKGELRDNLLGSGALMGILSVQSINAGRGANEDLRDAMMSTGSALLHTQEFISSGLMSSIFGSPEAISQKLDALAGVDVRDAREARVMLRSGINSQIRMLKEAEGSIMSKLHLQYSKDSGAYYIPASDEDAIRVADHWYEGEMRPEGFFIDPKQPVGGPQKWTDLMDRRKALNVAERAFEALKVEEPEEAGGIVTTELTPDYQSMSLDALNSAQEKLGWSETDSTDKLTDFLKNDGQGIKPKETAWCAAFVNSTLEESGLNGTGALNARSFLNWGTEVSDPQEGDIVVLSRGTSGWEGHVGFFKGYDDKGNILILGGNQGDAVSIKSYAKDRLLGFRRANGEQLPVDKAREEATELSLALSPGGLEAGPDVSSGAPTQPKSPDVSDSAVIADASGIAKVTADARAMSNNDAVAQIDDKLRDKTPSKPKRASLQEIVDKLLTTKQRNQIRAAGFEPSEVVFFENEAAAEKALADGEVAPNTLWVDSQGNVFLLE